MRLSDQENGKIKLHKWKGVAGEVDWEKIPLAYLEKLVESMPRRIEVVIKAKGGATKY